jgi:hypothetical protein
MLEQEWTVCTIHHITCDNHCAICNSNANLIRVVPKYHWEDVKDEWSPAIKAAFPTNSESHEQYATAMKMVSNRHSKWALIALINWLLVENDKLKATNNELVEETNK